MLSSSSSSTSAHSHNPSLAPATTLSSENITKASVPGTSMNPVGMATAPRPVVPTTVPEASGAPASATSAVGSALSATPSANSTAASTTSSAVNGPPPPATPLPATNPPSTTSLASLGVPPATSAVPASPLGRPAGVAASINSSYAARPMAKPLSSSASAVTSMMGSSATASATAPRNGSNAPLTSTPGRTVPGAAQAAPYTNVVNASTMCQQGRTSSTPAPQVPVPASTQYTAPASTPAPTPAAGSIAATPPSASADGAASTGMSSADLGTIKQLLEAIESERLRKKQLEWYLQEVINEKQELMLAHQAQGLAKAGPSYFAQPSAFMSAEAGKAQNVQHVLDGVDNYMFTKKRRLSVTAPSGSLGEALQPPLKKASVTFDDASIAGFLSFQDDELQSLITAPSLPPESVSTPASSLSSESGDSQSDSQSSSASSSPSSSSSSDEITVPPLINSTSLTPRRASICLTPSGSLSLQPSSGSFSLSLPGLGIPLPAGKGSISSYSFSIDPMVLCGWAYPQSEATPSQPGGGRGSFLQLDPRISFDWNVWSNEDQFKEGMTEFLDF